MGQEDVLVEVIINGKDMLQFYSTKENYKTLYEDRDALVDTVKTAFKEGILYSAEISNVEEIQTVQFLSEVTDVTVESSQVEQVVQDGEQYQAYEIIEEQIDNLTSASIPEELIIDVGLASDERLNLCPHCDYRTFNIGHFKIHMRQHTGENPYECHQCDYRSKQKSNLKRHMRQHLLGKDHFECKLCNFTCTQEKTYKRHLILHSRTRPLRPCPFCDYFSTSLAHLTVHIRQHTGETPYHCGLCSYKTVQKSNLTRHLKKHRKGRTSKADKLRCCSYCTYRTPNPAHLLAHIRAAHTGETPFACNICNYKSAQRSNLKRHLRKHSGERPFRCHICNYSTAYAYVLKKHIENHPLDEDQEDITCETCDYTTKSRLDYKRHLKIHMGLPYHCCYICGYISLNADLLKIHMRKHQKKLYKCKFCNFKAIQLASLKQHILYKHSGASKKGKKVLDSEGHIIEGDEMHEDNEMMNEDHMNSDNTDHIQEFKEEYIEEAYLDETEVSQQVTKVGEMDKNTVELETESVEVVVNEEDVITTPMDDEQQYEIIEYDEGNTSSKTYRCVECSFMCHDFSEFKVHLCEQRKGEHYKCKLCGFRASTESNINKHIKKHLGDVKPGVSHSGETGSPKPKNLSFLNKKQAEKLREFKRRLQEGMLMNAAQNVINSHQSNGSERIQISGDADNISENTESCTEETCLDDELNESSVIQTEISESQNVQNIEGHVVYETESLTLNHLEEDSSVLIVEENMAEGEVEAEGDYEVFEGEIETLEEPERDEGQSSQVVIACELCGFETYTVSELKAHIGTHTGETNLSSTAQNGIITPSYFTCDKCNFRAYKKMDVGRHKALFHGATPVQRLTFICSKCDFKTASKSEFTEHMEEGHKLPNLTVECKICEFKVSSEEELKQHSRNHIGEEPFECYYCAYLTARKCHLRSHMKRRHNIARNGKGPPIYQCYTCGYETSRRMDFHNHISQHKSEVNKTFKCQFDHCRFLTLDPEVYRKHLGIHTAGATKREPETLEAAIANATRESLMNESRANNSDNLKKYKRIPLKEYGNVPENEKNKFLHRNSVSGSANGTSGLLYKKLLKEDASNSPVKKKRRSLRSINPEESVIEHRLSRKFNFNPKNLVSSPKRYEHGYKVDFTGEVYKGHGSLRKFMNFGEVIQKSEHDVTLVMSHPENESQLKVAYNQLKDMFSSMKNKNSDSSLQFKIFFKEMDEDELKSDEILTDVELEISSEEDISGISLKDIEESDMDLDEISDTDTFTGGSNLRSTSPDLVDSDSKVEKNGFKSSAPEILIDLDGSDKLKYIQNKIRERNEKRKELRRLKAMNISSFLK